MMYMGLLRNGYNEKSNLLYSSYICSWEYHHHNSIVTVPDVNETQAVTGHIRVETS